MILKVKKHMGWVTIILAIIGFVFLAVFGLMIAGGLFAPAEYLQPWQPDYAAQFADVRLRAVAAGLLAPNGHNMQPWLIRLDEQDPQSFYLYGDPERLTPEVDPAARQFMVTQGAFLEYVRSAAGQLGYTAVIDLFPQGPIDEADLSASLRRLPIAKITLKAAAGQPDSLAQYIYLADTNRSAYADQPLTPAQLEALQSIPMGSGLKLSVITQPETVQDLNAIALQAAKVEASVERVMAEGDAIFRANEGQKNNYRYGFSVEGQGTQGLMKYLLQGLLTLFPSMNNSQASAERYIQTAEMETAHTPAYVFILSQDNSRASQVLAGMAYARLVLNAHAQDLVVQPMSQALEEYAEMRPVYERIHSAYAPGGETIQMLVRIGQATVTYPPSMRRDVQDLLINTP